MYCRAAGIGFVCHVLAGEGRGNLQDFVLYSMELMTFVTSLAVSIPGIVRTIYALLSNFQTYVQLESFSCLLHVL